MVRGPRRGTPVMAGVAPADSRRHDRKMAKVLAQSHGGFAGKSIIELLEDELTEVCVQYLVLKAEYKPDEGSGSSHSLARTQSEQRKIAEARGRVRGLAISIAMMRHTQRRHEQVWWNYVKKLEKRHVEKAREMMPDF